MSRHAQGDDGPTDGHAIETSLPVAEPTASRAFRLEALTGVRIFAAGFVFLSHIGPPLVLVFVIVRTKTLGASVAQWLEQVLAVQAWSSDSAVSFGLNSPAWPVSVEVFLYAAFPILVILLARVRSTRALLIVLCMGSPRWSRLPGGSRSGRTGASRSGPRTPLTAGCVSTHSAVSAISRSASLVPVST